MSDSAPVRKWDVVVRNNGKGKWDIVLDRRDGTFEVLEGGFFQREFAVHRVTEWREELAADEEGWGLV